MLHFSSAIFSAALLLRHLQVVLLLGNHDLQYAYRVNAFESNLYTLEKEQLITGVIGNEWLRFKSTHFTQGYLCSHAGIHPGLFKDKLDDIEGYCLEGLRRAKKGEHHPTLNVGEARGGVIGSVGGPYWLDWGDFVPIDGISQIVGHSMYHHPLWKSGNLLLESGYPYYAEIEEGVLFIKKQGEV